MIQAQHVSERVENLLIDAFLSEKPVVLFLGQDAFAPATNQPDPMLVALAERIGYINSDVRGWAGLLVNHRLDDDHLRWLTERFERNVLSEATLAVFDLPWSAIFTTSIDPTIRGRLEVSGRQPEIIGCAEWFPTVPRSRARPPVSHLFGVSNGSSPKDLAPKSNAELTRRRNIQALSIASRMPEAATQLGLIIIDGFTPEKDWLSPDDLFSVFPAASTSKIIWFGADQNWVPELAVELVSRGELVIEPRRLGEVLAGIQADGSLNLSSLPAALEPGVLKLAGGRSLVIDPGLRLRVEASAAIVEDDWFTSSAHFSLSKADAFERFHGNLSSKRGLVEGIAQGFAIERKFESKLLIQVNNALKQQEDLNRIVLLHGQSATGKSIALARLALVLRRDAHLPVLYARNRLPQVQDILAFSELAEMNGALATVIIADCNLRADRYRDLAAGLRAKGRRIVLVGTAYFHEAVREANGFVEAPTSLTQDEQEFLQKLLEVNGYSAAAKVITDKDNSLAWIYRNLSSSREGIISGVAREAREAEELIRSRMQVTKHSEIRSQLAEQLIKAGCHNGDLPMFESAQELDKLGGDAAGRLIDLVMVAGRLGSSVPLNLLLRVVGATYNLDVVEIARLFEDLDLFRWSYADEQQSELNVTSRIQLEADLICRRRLPDIRSEIDRLLDLIGGVRSSSIEERIELDFLRDLLQRLDADGPRGDVYASGYLDIAQAITNLRIKNRVSDSRLMLQESAFRRAALRTNHEEEPFCKEFNASKRAVILNEARSVVEEALLAIDAGQLYAAARTKDNLLVERASIYGFLAVGRAKTDEASEDVWSDYLAARSASRAAMGTVNSYFPLDVALWTSSDILLEATELNVVRRAELVADLHEILDEVDTANLSPEQQERFQRQRVKAARVLKNNEMSEDALVSLERLNPPAAIFLRARMIAEDVLSNADRGFDATARAQAAVSVNFLDKNLSKIGNDSRCLSLLLTLKWIVAIGHRPFRGDKQPLSRELAKRKDISSIVDSLVEIAGTNAKFSLRHLQATIHWIAGDSRHAESLWKSLSRDAESEDRTRMTRKYFIADASGSPVWFVGRIIEQRTPGHWRVAVNGIEGRIGLLESDFRGQEIMEGREIRRFAIAFNYIGPIADASNRYGDAR